MINQLKEQIKVVVLARDIAQRAKDVVNDARTQWEEEHIIWFDTARDTENAVSEAEAQLRELTLNAWVATGNKAPAPGVGIREMIRLVYDEQIAFDWAKSHKIALKLDSKAFEKIAKASPLDFVKVLTETQATISPKLEVI
ncbi:MAG: hypothetical protein KAR06_04825 [Deltaproteobacteria bacterium]|nr:hypothetical protein [Deltaproteobacteria bacterium]